MRTKHTPEKWIANTDVSVVGYEEHDGKVFVIADVYGRPGFADERSANATLIAAAPDLLAAATAVIERWDTPLWKDVPATAEYIAALRVAVAKGLGQNA